MTRNNRNRDDSERGLLRILLSLAITILTLGCGLALLLTLAAPYIAATHGWLFPLLGLVAPATYILAIILALYYIVRWRWRAAIPLIILLIAGAAQVSLFVKTPFTKDYGLESYRGCTKFMTFNIRNFINDKRQRSMGEFADYIEEVKPDIICLQEFDDNAKGYNSEFKSRMTRYNRAGDASVVIFSRYPILGYKDIFEDNHEVEGRSIWADILIGKDTIRVFNNHLHSTTITSKDDEFLTSKRIVIDTARKERIIGIVERFSYGAHERVNQVLVIRKEIDNSPHKYIVCGDFNDTPISYTYNQLSRGMKDAFQECGDGYSYTFRGFNNILRIDYILTSKGITPMSYLSDSKCTISDHLPVISYLKIDKKPQIKN